MSPQARAKESPIKEQRKTSSESFSQQSSDQNQNYQTKVASKPVIKDKPSVALKKSSTVTEKENNDSGVISERTRKQMERNRKQSEHLDQSDKSRKLSEQSFKIKKIS